MSLKQFLSDTNSGTVYLYTVSAFLGPRFSKLSADPYGYYDPPRILEDFTNFILLILHTNHNIISAGHHKLAPNLAHVLPCSASSTYFAYPA